MIFIRLKSTAFGIEICGVEVISPFVTTKTSSVCTYSLPFFTEIVNSPS